MFWLACYVHINAVMLAMLVGSRCSSHRINGVKGAQANRVPHHVRWIGMLGGLVCICLQTEQLCYCRSTSIGSVMASAQGSVGNAVDDWHRSSQETSLRKQVYKAYCNLYANVNYDDNPPVCGGGKGGRGTL